MEDVHETVAPGTVMPADIELISEFVNTVDVGEGTDDLTTRKELSSFLQTHGLVRRRTPSSDDELEIALGLRAGLREALVLNHDEEASPLPYLETVAAKLPMVMSWEGDSPSLRPATDGVLGALTEIVVAVQRAAADDSWSRLKICQLDSCQWAYYDASKNHSKNWCGTGCGNKVKTKAYRARQRDAARK